MKWFCPYCWSRFLTKNDVSKHIVSEHQKEISETDEGFNSLEWMSK